MQYDYSKMKVYQRIIAFCKEYGSITTRDGFMELGTSKVSTRIGELQNDYGYVFRKEPETSPNRWGERIPYKRYYLVKEPDNGFELPLKANKKLCDCTCADVCPFGKSGSESRCYV